MTHITVITLIKLGIHQHLSNDTMTRNETYLSKIFVSFYVSFHKKKEGAVASLTSVLHHKIPDFHVRSRTPKPFQWNCIVTQEVLCFLSSEPKIHLVVWGILAWCGIALHHRTHPDVQTNRCVQTNHAALLLHIHTMLISYVLSCSTGLKLDLNYTFPRAKHHICGRKRVAWNCKLYSKL